VFRGRVPLGRVALGLLALKLVAGIPLLLERGLVASYFANDGWRAPRERSLDFLMSPAGRVDRRLEFTSWRPFPLFFFNDNSRFNFYRPGDPDRWKLAFSVTWRAWMAAPRPGPSRFYLSTARAGAGGTASLAIEGTRVLTLDATSTRAEGTVTIGPGWHSIDVQYACPYGAARGFSAGLVEDGRDRPLGADLAYVLPAPPGRVAADRVVRALSRLADGIAIAVLLAWTAVCAASDLRHAWPRARNRHRASWVAAVAPITALALIGVATIRARPLIGVPPFLSGGDDWLTHETLARDIALNDPLMTRGKPVGRAAPFSTQPLYPYFLALVHLVAGEDFWGIYLAQQLLLAVMVWATYRFTREVFGPAAAWPAGGLAWLFAAQGSLNQRPLRLAESLLGEALFLPLVALWVLTLARLRGPRPPSRWMAAGAGALGGVAVLTRSPLLLAVPFVGLLVLADWRRRWSRAGTVPIVVLASSLAATVGLATLRNVVASGQWVVVSNAGPINLHEGNKPPPGIDVSRAETRAIYRRLGLDPLVARVVEYAVRAPATFALGLGRRAAYALGLTGRTGEERLLVVLWVSAGIGIIRVLSSSEPADPIRFVPAVIAACQFVVVVVIGNITYGYRLLYPMYLMLVPYSAYAASVAWRALLTRLVQTH
jgi:hypothetical protein